MQTNNDSNYSTILLALCAGVGTGVAVGLLLAKQSGRELRSEIGESVGGYVNSARQKATELKDSATDFARHGIGELSRAKDKAVDSGEKGAHRAIDIASGKSHDAVEDAAQSLRAIPNN